MRRYIHILFLTLILFSCSQKKIENLNGSWRLDYDEQTKSPFFPFELFFEGDTLIMIDGHNFKNQIRYQIKGDSIEMSFSNGSIKKMDFSIYSDSMIFLGAGKFYKIPNDFLNIVKPYDLIEFKTNEILIDNAYSSVIHLVKNGGQVQVILNDVTTDLENIPDFLVTSHGSPPPLILYLGKGLEFKELVEAYMWIKVAWINRVTLVTGNDAFDKFYIVKDYISIDDSLMDVFLKKENIPPFPPSPIEITEIKRNIIKIDNQADFEKLLTINDSTEYLIQVDNQFDLFGYLELIGKIKGKKNIKKVITAW